MKPSKDKLYSAIGEMIYAVAKADGIVQASETSKLVTLLTHIPGAADIEWSFNYEKTKNTSVAETFDRALETCKAYGPAEEYAILFDALDVIAKASEDGIHPEEQAVIDRFKYELKEHFLTLDL